MSRKSLARSCDERSKESWTTITLVYVMYILDVLSWIDGRFTAVACHGWTEASQDSDTEALENWRNAFSHERRLYFRCGNGVHTKILYNFQSHSILYVSSFQTFDFASKNFLPLIDPDISFVSAFFVRITFPFQFGAEFWCWCYYIL